MNKTNPVEVARKLYSEAQDLDTLRDICRGLSGTVQLAAKEEFHAAVTRIKGTVSTPKVAEHPITDFWNQRRVALKEERKTQAARRRQRRATLAQSGPPIYTIKVAEGPMPECVMKRGGVMRRVWTKPLLDQMLKDGWKVLSNQPVSLKKGS